MGGLVGLYYLKRLGGRHRVRRLIMLGTPDAGDLVGAARPGHGAARAWPACSCCPAAPSCASWPRCRCRQGVEVVSIGADPRLAGAAVDAPCSTASATSRCPRATPGLLVDEEVAEVVVELLREPRALPSPTGALVDAHGAANLKLLSFEHL